MNRIYQSVVETIGNTPIIQLHHEIPEGVTLLVKQESRNPGGSIKDRIALSIIEDAEKSGRLRPGDTIIEATSGNTGIGLALVGASKGYHVVITMPDSLSVERRRLLKHLGAELHLTPAEEGMKGAIAKANELQKTIKGAILANQFENHANPAAHSCHTGPEIIEVLKENTMELDYFVAGVGTGGTLSGCGEILRQAFPGIRIVAVEPDGSPVLSGGTPGPHGIQGIGAGFIPEVLNTDLIDEIISIDTEKAIAAAKTLASKEGLLCGISSGAAAAAALEIANRPENRGNVILAVLPDTGERYVSTLLFS